MQAKLDFLRYKTEETKLRRQDFSTYLKKQHIHSLSFNCSGPNFQSKSRCGGLHLKSVYPRFFYSPTPTISFTEEVVLNCSEYDCHIIATIGARSLSLLSRASEAHIDY